MTREPKNISRGNIGVSATGSDYSIRIDEKQAWNSNYEYLEYTNQKASEIISNLLSFVPEVSTNVIPYSSEPRISWECSRSSSVLDNVKSICEYTGYEWFVLPNGSMRIRKPLEETEINSNHMMLLGDISDIVGLPDLPYVYIRNISIGNDDKKVHNFYRVDGKNDIYGVGFNQYSINRIGRKIEGFFRDERLTSTQSCQVVAKALSEINGASARSIDVNASGVTEMKPGDIVYLASSKNRSDIFPGYYKLLKKSSNIGGIGWRSQYMFGKLKGSIASLIR